MARKRVREYDIKKNFYKFIGKEYKGIMISNLDQLDNLNIEGNLVVKVDELFNKRYKTGLIKLNVSIGEAKDFIRQNYGKIVNNIILKHFLIEPYIPHSDEKYIAIISERYGDRILYSDEGGVNIEENWNSVKEEFIPHDEISSKFEKFHKFFKYTEFSYLEFNPYTNDIPLGAVGEIDSYSLYKEKFIIEYSDPSEKIKTDEEKQIEQLDKNSGASFKFSILNPNGKIWLMVAGGGASLVFADSIYLNGLGKELANYAEYSGNPSTTETYEYAKLFFKAMFKQSGEKILVIGGGIANFTDVSKTFDGIIKAIKDYKDLFIRDSVKIYVRRGGPNSDKGLAKIREEVSALNIPIKVYSEDTPIDEVILDIKENF